MPFRASHRALRAVRPFRDGATLGDRTNAHVWPAAARFAHATCDVANARHWLRGDCRQARDFAAALQRPIKFGRPRDPCQGRKHWADPWRNTCRRHVRARAREGAMQGRAGTRAVAAAFVALFASLAGEASARENATSAFAVLAIDKCEVCTTDGDSIFCTEGSGYIFDAETPRTYVNYDARGDPIPGERSRRPRLCHISRKGLCRRPEHQGNSRRAPCRSLPCDPSLPPVCCLRRTLL